MTLVVDASVALRWYLGSPGSEAAAELLEGDDLLLAPDLIVAEVGNAAWKLVQAGEISAKHGARIASAVPFAFSMLVGAPRLSARAYALALELEHPVYDCFYLALAELENAVVVTADRRLLNKMASTEYAGLVQPLAID